MKKTIFLTALFLFLVSGVYVFSQERLQTDSNTITTKVGSPPTASGPSSCPIPGGVPSCGSRNNPRASCGHCGAGYEGYPCDYPSLQYALDVPGSYGQSVILPSVGGQSIKWAHVAQQMKSDGRTAIQYYGGTNEATGEQYWIQLHHTAPGSGGGTKTSGQEGARICNAPCEVGSGPHVHIEFARVGNNGVKEWLDAPLYFCGS